MANKRRSEACMEALQSSRAGVDLEDEEKKRLDWEIAVTDELKYLDEQQKALQQTLEKYKPDESISVIEEPSLKQKLDKALDMLVTVSNTVTVFQTRITNLEKENVELTQKNIELDIKFENLLKDSVGLEDLQALKSHCLDTVGEMSQKLNQEIEKLNEICDAPATVSSAPSRKFKIDMPKFKGHEQESPMRYIADLRKYVQYARPSRSELLCILSQSLEESAKNWWFLQEQDVLNLESFVERFKEHFWNAPIQRNAKRKVEFGKFNASGKMTRVEYAIHLFSLIKELEIHETESESIEKIRDHFDANIRHALIGQQIKTKNDLFKILAEYDSDDKKERLAQNRAAFQNKGPAPQKPPQQMQQNKPWQVKSVNALRAVSTPTNKGGCPRITSEMRQNVNAIRAYDTPRSDCETIVPSDENCEIENCKRVDDDVSKLTSDSGNVQ